MAYFTLPDDYLARARRLEHAGLPVAMPDGSVYSVRNLLTEQDDNVKLAKSGKANAGF